MADLMKSLNPNFHVCPPIDVRFWFKEQDGIIKEVKAHKVILASASEVFNKQFFGSLEAEDNIEIVDVCQEVFLAMIEFIYNKKPNFKDADLRFLSSLYYLSDKYDIQIIKSEILVFISKLEVTKDNVLDTAIIAEENILHPPLSEALFEAAARFVMKADGYEKKFNEVMNLCAGDSEAHALVIVKLLKRIKDHDCKNRQQGPLAGENPLSFLRDIEEFQQMKTLIQHNPNILSSVLQLIEQSNQSLLQMISQNQEVFIRMINE